METVSLQLDTQDRADESAQGLNTGCVPSKAMIRCGAAAASIKSASKFGVTVDGSTKVDFARVMERMREIRARISPNDSAQGKKDLGADVFLGTGRFVSKDCVQVVCDDGSKVDLHFGRCCIATGGRPRAPSIPGIDEAGYFTSDNIFDIVQQPKSLLVIGGGPIGCELAQTFARLGTQVTLVHDQHRLLDREDDDAAQVIIEQMEQDGVKVILNSSPTKITRTGDEVEIEYTSKNGQAGPSFKVNEILVAAGRTPNVESLDLDKAQVEANAKGIVVNDYLQSVTNPNVFACGDVAVKYQFTHAAEAGARIVANNALFSFVWGRQKMSEVIVPWTTYTHPEVGRVGLGQREATEQQIPVDVYIKRFNDVDRALTDGEEEGFVKVLCAKDTDKILGATIVCSHAGDIIPQIVTAMRFGITLGQFAYVVHPYPTIAEAIKGLGFQYTMKQYATPEARKWFKMLREQMASHGDLGDLADPSFPLPPSPFPPNL